MTEFAEVTDNDPTSITCVCGNSSGHEGMIQCDSNGIAFHLLEGDVPEGLAEMPDDVHQLYTLCPVCGRIYHDQTIVSTNIAPVHKTVDVKEGPAHDALALHWKLGD